MTVCLALSESLLLETSVDRTLVVNIRPVYFCATRNGALKTVPPKCHSNHFKTSLAMLKRAGHFGCSSGNAIPGGG